MKYALKGTDEEWANALKNKDEVDGSTVQIKRTQEVTPKRKAENSAEILESIMKSDKGASGGKGKKSKSKKKLRKTIG